MHRFESGFPFRPTTLVGDEEIQPGSTAIDQNIIWQTPTVIRNKAFRARVALVDNFGAFGALARARPRQAWARRTLSRRTKITKQFPDGRRRGRRAGVVSTRAEAGKGCPSVVRAGPPPRGRR